MQEQTPSHWCFNPCQCTKRHLIHCIYMFIQYIIKAVRSRCHCMLVPQRTWTKCIFSFFCYTKITKRTGLQIQEEHTLKHTCQDQFRSIFSGENIHWQFIQLQQNPRVTQKYLLYCSFVKFIKLIILCLCIAVKCVKKSIFT